MTILGKDIYVTAYPKSGITWLVRLLSDALDSPVYDRSTGDYRWWGDKGGDYVIHKRREYYQPKLHDGKTIVFLQRDPRDVVISAWFYRGRKIPLEQSMRTMWQGKHYANWVNSWLNLEPEVICTRYEWLGEHYANWVNNRLKLRTRHGWLAKYDAAELLTLVHLITNKYLTERCSRAINNHSFENMSVQMNDPHFMRKGIVGDYKNYFTKEIAKEFNDHLGKFMLEKGYVDNLNWWKEL